MRWKTPTKGSISVRKFEFCIFFIDSDIAVYRAEFLSYLFNKRCSIISLLKFLKAE